MHSYPQVTSGSMYETWDHGLNDKRLHRLDIRDSSTQVIVNISFSGYNSSTSASLHYSNSSKQETFILIITSNSCLPPLLDVIGGSIILVITHHYYRCC